MLLPVIAVCAIPIGLTYSRMAAVAVVMVVVALIIAIVRGRSTVVFAALALCVGVLVPAVLTLGGWVARAAPTVTTESINLVTSSRGTLLGQATELIRDEPVFGVGPGRYLLELENMLGIDPEEEVYPVHAVPILVAAENGVPAGVFVAAGLAWLGSVALRRGTAVTVIFLSYLPFHLLDHFPYDNFQGLTMTGLWVGAILAEGTRR